MNIKNEIKAILAANGWSQTRVVKKLNEKHGTDFTAQNFSNKLAKGTLRYSEALEIAELIGCKIEWRRIEE